MKKVTVLKYVSDIRGLSQTDIANTVGSTSRQTVYKWFVGEKPIPKKFQSKLEEMIGFKSDFLQNELTPQNKIIVLEREIEMVRNSNK